MLSVAADLDKDKDLKNLIDRTIDTFGRLDILVNNAGRGDLSYMCDPKIMELYDNIMHLNVRSVMCLTSLAIPYLEKTKGTIINISSIAAMKPVSNLKAIDRFNVINDLVASHSGSKDNGLLHVQVLHRYADQMYGHRDGAQRHSSQ